MKVKATELFKKLNLRPCELNHIPEKDEEFEVTQERYKALSKHNYGCFVIKVEAEIEKETIKAKKK